MTGSGVSTVKDAFLDTQTTIYDARSSVTKQIDAVGRTAYFDFDLKRRTQHQSNALGQVSYMGYDARSSQVVLVNPRSYPTYFTFDALRRTSSSKDALGGVRYFGYDQVGNRVLGLDELSNPSYFQYDGLNRLSQSIDAALAVTYLGYDAVSNLVRRTDADQRNIYFTYDGARRLSMLMPNADPWLYYAYDAVGNRTVIVDDTGTSVHAVDKLDRLTSKGNLAGTVSYQWDRSVKKAKLTDTVGQLTYHIHDVAGRLSILEVSNARPVYYGYDASGKLTSKVLFNHNVASYYTFDVAGRLSRLANNNVSYYVYTRNEVGAITQELVESGDTKYFAFDALDRLTSEKRISVAGALVYAFTYSYDAASERLTKTDAVLPQATYFVYDTRNLLTLDSVLMPPSTWKTTYYQYDQSQRMTRLTDGSTTAINTSYFAFNQRNMVTNVSSPGIALYSYPTFKYTGVGERVSWQEGPTIPSPLYYFAYDGRKLLSEIRVGGAAIRYYRHNQSSVDPQGSHVELASTYGFSYPALDENGSLRNLHSDAVSDSFERDYFGLTIGATDTQGSRLRAEAPTGAVRLLDASASVEMYVLSGGGLWIPRLGAFLGVQRLLALPLLFDVLGDGFRIFGTDIRVSDGDCPAPLLPRGWYPCDPSLTPKGWKPGRCPCPSEKWYLGDDGCCHPRYTEDRPSARKDLVFILYIPFHGYSSLAADQSGWVSNGNDSDPLASSWVAKGTRVATFEQMFADIGLEEPRSIASVTIWAHAEPGEMISGDYVPAHAPNAANLNARTAQGHFKGGFDALRTVFDLDSAPVLQLASCSVADGQNGMTLLRTLSSLLPGVTVSGPTVHVSGTFGGCMIHYPTSIEELKRIPDERQFRDGHEIPYHAP